MSLVMQIIQAVTATERAIDDQMAKLTSYNAKVDEVMRRVQAELGDSTTNYAQEMISQLQQTKEQANQIAALTRPSYSGQQATIAVSAAAQSVLKAAAIMKTLCRTCDNYITYAMK